MPHYDYRCPQCGKFTIHQGIKEKPLDVCPDCGSSVHRLISKNVNIIFKGGGFYCTDTRSPSGTVKTDSSESEAASDSKKNLLKEKQGAAEQRVVKDSKASTEPKAVNE